MLRLFTIGYGGRKPGELVELLVRNGVRTLADIRIAPQRAFIGSFAKAKTADAGIETLLNRAEIEYAWLQELGNPFRANEDWGAPYRELLEREGEARTRRLLALAQPVCLMCAEKLPSDCHRTLVAEWLAQRGHSFEHIT